MRKSLILPCKRSVKKSVEKICGLKRALRRACFAVRGRRCEVFEGSDSGLTRAPPSCFFFTCRPPGRVWTVKF